MPAKKKSQKTYAIMHFFPGGTKKQYDASIAAVHPKKDGLPKGQISHLAGPTAGGWTIVAVHDSKKSWEQFRDGVLLPRMQQGIKGGLPPPAQETTMVVHRFHR